MLYKAERSPGFISPEFYFWMYEIMKRFLIFSVRVILVLFLCTAFFTACKKSGANSANVMDKDTSYAMGMLLARQMTEAGFTDLKYDYEAFKEGFKAFNEAAETRLSWEQAVEKINAYIVQLQAKENEKMLLDGERNREEGEAFLAENGNRSGVITTSSGLQYEVISEGNGDKPLATDVVRVHYEGTLLDGTVFDSSYARGVPVEFSLAGVIPGWTEGVQLMREGSTYRFVIPSDLAYGSGGAGPIPPNSTLIFKVELISILK